METLCPHCETRYQINRETLAAANGLVRCSRCRNVFNALRHLSRSPGDEEPLPLIEEQEGRTEVKSDLPSLKPDEPTSDNRLDAELSVAPESSDRVLDIHDALAAPRRRALRNGVYGVVALLLVASVAAQLAWFERDRLLSHPRSRDLLERACDRLNCTLPEWRDPAKYEVLQRSLAPKPGQRGVLVLEGQFVNRAAVPQRLPLLQLSFLDSNEQLLARRRLQPREYLASPTLDGQLAAPKEVFTIDVALEDPGPQATGFELSFY